MQNKTGAYFENCSNDDDKKALGIYNNSIKRYIETKDDIIKAKDEYEKTKKGWFKSVSEFL